MKKFNKLKNLTDTNLLLLITIVVFFVMYLAAMISAGKLNFSNPFREEKKEKK